ncbi:MAG: hypothetical protein AB7Q81_09775 [Gammaproteobacteria bacterium]
MIPSAPSALRTLTAGLCGCLLLAGASVVSAATVTLSSDLQFSGFVDAGNAPGGPLDVVNVSLSLSFDTALGVTHQAVDGIHFDNGVLPTTAVFFDYRPAVEVTPGFFNFQLDVYHDLPGAGDADGLGVQFGQDDFLLRFAGIPAALDNRIAAGGGGGLPELLAARQMLYTSSQPGATSTFFHETADTAATTLTLPPAPVPLPAPAWLLAGALAALARRHRD